MNFKRTSSFATQIEEDLFILFLFPLVSCSFVVEIYYCFDNFPRCILELFLIQNVFIPLVSFWRLFILFFYFYLSSFFLIEPYPLSSLIEPYQVPFYTFFSTSFFFPLHLFIIPLISAYMSIEDSLFYLLFSLWFLQRVSTNIVTRTNLRTELF